MDSKTGRKLKNIKQHNRSLVLSLFESKRALSISEIAGKTHLSNTTISKMFSGFIAEGIVNPVGKGVSTEEGGKKPELFQLNANYRHVLVIKIISPGVTEGAILDLHCNILLHETIHTAPDLSYPENLKVISEITERLLKRLQLSTGNICSVSVACEGIVDSVSGIIRHPLHHPWSGNLPIRADLEKQLKFKAPVYIDNVCRYGGYAELLFEENRNLQSIITIWSDSLAGGCVLMQGQLLQGSNGMVGEFGHMSLVSNSKKCCSCGGYGCFETLISKDEVLLQAEGLYQKYGSSPLASKILKGELSIEDIFAASNKGDAFACKLLDRVVHYYSILIRNIVLLYSPQKIILQGVYAQAGDYFLEALRQKTTKLPFYDINTIDIVYSQYKSEEYFLVGAAFYAVRQFFNNI